METLKYKVIASDKQYDHYCNILEQLVFLKTKTRAVKDEIDLLTLLIEKYDETHNTFEDTDPIQMLYSLMNDHNMKAKDLADLLGISKGYVSDILHYKKGLSKDVIRTLASHFKMRQEAFNKPYDLLEHSAKPNRKAKNITVS